MTNKRTPEIQTFEIKITRQDIDQAQAELGPITPSGVSIGRSPLEIVLGRMGVRVHQCWLEFFRLDDGQSLGIYNWSKAYQNAACYWMGRDGRVSQKPVKITLRKGA